MGAIPGGIDTTHQPPMTVPLRHFLIALGFLVAGTVVGIGAAAGVVTGRGQLAHVHLLLAGWVCITIMGAMTQFVPVWSGTTLHSQRLANLQLALVSVGLIGFATALLLATPSWLVVCGGLMLTGFWTFVYNVGRTLATVDGLDVTEGHFAVALGFFLLLTLLGVTLAVHTVVPVLSALPVSHAGVLGAHVTLAVFGAVLTTVYGALYQLGTMFTQTNLHRIDHRLQSLEAVAHPLGVIVLATGRLVGNASVATVGGLLVLAAALAIAAVLLRKLVEMQVERTPMHTRYAVVGGALGLWALWSVPAWITAPTARAHLFGADGSVHLLVLGVIGFVILGTLYHIVPFVVWVRRYSDRLGFEDVPMIDDLYDDLLAAGDGSLVFAGTVLLVAADRFDLPSLVAGIGGGLVGVGVLAFIANLVLVVHRHSTHPLDRIVLGALSPRRNG